MHVLVTALVLLSRAQPHLDAVRALPQQRRYTLPEHTIQEPQERDKRDDLGDQRPVNVLHASVYSANFGHGLARQVGDDLVRPLTVGCRVQ